MKRPAPNLVTRVALVMFILIALPLIAIGFLLYQNDKKQFEQNAKYALIEESSEAQMRFIKVYNSLYTTIQELSETLSYGDNVDTKTLEENLRRFSVDETLTSLIFEKQGDLWKLVASSHKAFPEAAIEQKELSKTDTRESQKSTWIGQANSSWFFVSKKTSPKYIIALAKPLSKIDADLSVKKPYPLSVSLVYLNKEPPAPCSKCFFFEKELMALPYKLVLSISKEKFYAQLHKSWIYRMGWISISCLAVMIAIAFFIGKRMSKPLKKLRAVMDALASGNLQARVPENIGGFEIGQIGREFNHTLDALETHIEAAQKERIAKEKLQSEFLIARKIQESLFPKKLPAVTSLKISSHFEPADQVSGDFYDLYLSNNRLLITIADGAGKGISACLFSQSVRSALRALIDQGLPLEDAVSKTSHLLTQDAEHTGMFVTAWVGVMDTTTFELTYTSCGHPPAFLKTSEGKIKPLNTDSPALGIESHFETKKISFDKGDSLLLYTDGLFEQSNASGEEFGLERTQELFAKSTQSHEVLENICTAFTTFQGDENRFDDLTLLLISRPKGQSL